NSLVLGSIAGLNGASSSVKVGIGTTQPQHPLDVKAASAAPLIMLENTTAIGETALRLRSNWPSDGSSNTTITLGLEGSKFNIYADNSISLLTLNPVQAGDFSQGIRMGINNFSPQAPLHVKSSSTSTLARNITFFNSAAATIGANPSWTGTVTGYFEGNVVSTISFIAAANNIFSDERIKDIIGPSNGADDLDKLRRIAITRYRYKDKWQMGNAVQTKVIAQQVKEVLPEAVSQIKNFIPDLLQEAAIVARGNNSITIQLKEGKQLKAGARLKCFDAGGNELLANVLSTKDNTCTLDVVITGDKIFVYGTEVNDFNVVDYDAIAMLNVSATQELLRRLEKAEQTIVKLEALLKKLTKDQ
ncbi:MAG TPA: tail fiber domain-containing protein, partial [Phnomibacter sp.]|nr:tail fiber domain-containing protein [Phnomibacter sp.]